MIEACYHGANPYVTMESVRDDLDSRGQNRPSPKRTEPVYGRQKVNLKCAVACESMNQAQAECLDQAKI